MIDRSHVYTAYIHTSPARLWQALTDGTETRKYFDFVAGFLTVDSTWEIGRPIAYRTGDNALQIEGQILEIDPPARLRTSFSALYDPDVEREPATDLEWIITRMGEVCKLVVTHAGADVAPATARDMAICMPSILANLTILQQTGRPRLLKEIVFDCTSPARLARFWSAAAGYVVQGPQPEESDAFVAVADPLGVGPELAFQRVPEPKLGKNRMHFDLAVTDRDAEVRRLLDLGASIVHPLDAWTVMADPEGNEFCVTSV